MNRPLPDANEKGQPTMSDISSATEADDADDAHRAHFAHWPPGLPHHLTLPNTNLFYNAEVSAKRFPDKPFLQFYGSALTFSAFHAEAERLAGYLQQTLGVRAGDRVLLYLQNSPQWVLGYYAILRANAVVVPVNPMNRSEELAHYVEDTGARVAIAAQDLLPELQAHLDPQQPD